MQTKTNDDPLKKMTKSQKIGLIGGIAGTAAQFIPGVGPIVSAAINAGTQGIQQNVAGKEAEAAAGEQAKRSSAASLVASNEGAMNAASNLGVKPVYNPNDPFATGFDPSMIKKTGKVLKPITSYYGEAKNLSSLAYRDSILMKTVSGVSTLGNKEDRIVVGKDYKRGSYVPEYILEDMIREQTGDYAKDSVQDYTKVKGFGKNKYVKLRKDK